MRVFVFCPATVTAVPVTSTVVIRIVTGLIAFPCYDFATTFAFGDSRVQTLAFRAVAVLGLCVFFVAATVTPVPTTATNVIDVVAIAIAFPNMYPAFRTAFHNFAVDENALVIRVFTHTVATVCFEVHITRSAAVATVPVASTVVICFVTNTVVLPTKHLASCSADSIRVQAGTRFAIFVVVVRPTTVAAIPIASAIIVTIVACAVPFPWTMETFPFALEFSTPF